MEVPAGGPFGRSARRGLVLREFEEIFRQNRLYRKYDAQLVWEEIRSIIKGAKPPISVNRFGRLVARYPGEGLSRSGLIELKELLLGLKHLEIMGKIEKLVVLKAWYRSYEEFLLSLEPGSAPSSRNQVPRALQEILRILEKKASAFTEPLLTLQEYVTLGRKRAPNFVYSREEIDSIAEFYHGKLEAQGLWDEIDLCKSALQVLGRSSDRFLYDEEALLYFVESGLPSHSVRYLNEAGDFDVSADLLTRLSRSQPVTGSLHASEERQACIDLVVQLFRKRLRTHRDEETQGLVEEFLSRFGYPDYEFEEVVPDSFFDLALESRSYGTVFRAVLSQRYRKSLSPRVPSLKR